MKKNQFNYVRMKQILRDLGIEMKVEACGCCSGPYVTFSYNGELIFDEDEANFDTSVPDE